MQTPLRDLENDGSVDSMTITLRCGHIFTVETLDGLTHLNDFYDRDYNGKWVQAVTPETHGENRTRPVCPTCRGDITALRYGRVCKSSNLAIMQHNISTKLSGLLAQAEATLEKAMPSLEASIVGTIEKCDAYTPAPPATIRTANDKLDILLRKEPSRPTPVATLELLDVYHALPLSHKKIWIGAIKQILPAYKQARMVSEHRDPNVKTYEASLSTLFQEEMDHFSANPGRATGDVEQVALRLARMRIGQPPPRASLRFMIEAFWVTIRILIILAETAKQASKAVLPRDSTVNRLPWIQLAEFLLKQALNDSKVALEFAEKSESWNKWAKCQVIVMQAQYELAAHRCHTAIEAGKTDSESRLVLVEQCEQGHRDAESLRMTVSEQYMAHWGANDRDYRRQWIEDNFLVPSAPILENWKDLKRSAGAGTWYAPVTNDERRQIMRGLMEGRDRISKQTTVLFTFS